LNSLYPKISIKRKLLTSCFTSLSCHIDEKLFAFVANTLSRFMAVALKTNAPKKQKSEHALSTCPHLLSPCKILSLSDYITTMKKHREKTDKENKTNWHRLWGLMVAPLFEKLKCEVTVEFDLSLKVQRLDMVVVTKLEDEPINFDEVNIDYYQGFENLNAHNLLKNDTLCVVVLS